MAKKLHTITLTVAAPAWLSRRDVKREVRTLINESTVWGTQKPGELEYVEHGDIRARKLV